MQESSDNLLMLEVKSGDLDKLGILFGRYHRQLFKFIYRMTSDAEESEDLVQNVFYRMLKYRHTFKGDGEFTTWMYHLARNVLADFHKKNNKFKYKRELNGQESNMLKEMSIEDHMTKEQDHIFLHQALGRLKVEEKEVLILSKFQGLKYEEIGEIMSCSEAAVKVRVYRALNELRKIYMKLNGLLI